VILEPVRAGAVPAAVVQPVPSGSVWPYPVDLAVGAGEPGADATAATRFDPVLRWGDAYGAQGVVSLVLAAHLVAGGHARAVGVTCGDAEDGWRRAAVCARNGSGPS
jgi:hypothetical protein